MTESAKSQQQSSIRAAVYIDGFNLYHPIHETGLSYLKWANLWDLGELLCAKDGLDLQKVLFCTAVPQHLPDKSGRHQTFNRAQLCCGVTIITGHHVYEPDREKYAEKQSDINVSLAVILDGIDNLYDVAFLISADSDQVATARVFHDRLAPLGKRLIGVAPLGRKVPDGYKKYNVPAVAITRHMLEQCVMDEYVQGVKNVITRPASYRPPADWVHPKNRPQGKPPKAPKKWGPAVKG